MKVTYYHEKREKRRRHIFRFIADNVDVDFPKFMEIERWCRVNLKGYWDVSQYAGYSLPVAVFWVYIKDPKDAMLFKLTWF